VVKPDRIIVVIEFDMTVFGIKKTPAVLLEARYTILYWACSVQTVWDANKEKGKHEAALELWRIFNCKKGNCTISPIL